MSLPQLELQGSLFESLGSIAADLFTDKDKYKLFATKVWPALVERRQQLEELYNSDNGRPAIEPVVLLGVLIFQFLERVPDRQAAELVKYHLGWKLALNLKLSYQGFHFTNLSNFRDRLIASGKSDLAFNGLLDALSKEGFVFKGVKQRLDSTHVLGAVALLSALECIRETLRLALEELQGALNGEELPDFWSLLWERYVENKLDYKSAAEVLKSKQRQAGDDCLRLLHWLEPMRTQLRQGRYVLLLREVFAQQYELKTPGQPEPVKEHATGVVQNPHDPQAQWSAKGKGKHKKSWVGYKVQVAETVPEKNDQSSPSFITSIVTQKATESDTAGLEQTLKTQAKTQVASAGELYVDGAYVCGARLAQAQKEGWQLVGPAQASPYQQELAPGYRLEDFQINLAQRQARCPAGVLSKQCSRIYDKSRNTVFYRFEWTTHCHGCKLRAHCLSDSAPHRIIAVGEHYQLLEQRRKEQKTEQFKERMHQRNGIEGTISELARAHGLRRSRYRGLAKVAFQNFFIGTACNVKRWLQVALETKTAPDTPLSALLNATSPLLALARRHPFRRGWFSPHPSFMANVFPC